MHVPLPAPSHPCVIVVQEGDLGGPRAVRVPGIMGDGAQELAELAGGGLLNGQEIIALLHGMQQMS